MKTYDEFWPFYLGEHSREWTQRLHAVGTSCGLVCLLMVLPLTRNAAWVFLGFGAGYVFAWLSHGLIEKNRPATLKNPWWSFFADFEMLAMLLSGRIGSEFEAQKQRPTPVPSGRRTAFRWAIRIVIPAYMAGAFVLWLQGHLSLQSPWA